MKIAIVTPVDLESSRGNGVTARRWGWILSEFGHEVDIRRAAGPVPDCDLLVALHARKSAAAIAAFRVVWPDRPVVLALTGTDLYVDLPDDAAAQSSVAAADRLVVLQPKGADRLPAAVRDRVHVIYQSVPAPLRPRDAPSGPCGFCVLAHLRDVKDPLLAARAAALLPAASTVTVTLAGAATAPEQAERATAAVAANPRFKWVGELSARAAADLLRRSHAVIVTSQVEGGANVVGEAIVAGVPVLATRVDGNVGLLGDDYGGYFPVGDAPALAALMRRVEADSGFIAALQAQLDTRRARFEPQREVDAWQALLASL